MNKKKLKTDTDQFSKFLHKIDNLKSHKQFDKQITGLLLYAPGNADVFGKDLETPFSDKKPTNLKIKQDHELFLKSNKLISTLYSIRLRHIVCTLVLLIALISVITTRSSFKDSTKNANWNLSSNALDYYKKTSRKYPVLLQAEILANTSCYNRHWMMKYLMGIPISLQKANQVNSLISPWSKPGDCWAFYGSQGSAIIELQNLTAVTHFTIEHANGVQERKSAPYEFIINGFDHHRRNIWLGTYFFDKKGPILQTKEVINSKSGLLFQKIELKILSNHGNPEYTCVYRFRIHGF